MLRITLRESRGQQIRRELDDVVNGTDYGASIEQADDDPTIARAKGLEIDDVVNGTDYGASVEQADNDPTVARAKGLEIDYKEHDDEEQEETDNKKKYSDGKTVHEWDDGTKEEIYRKNGKWHREDGPAVIRYDEFGRIDAKSYYINGKHLSETAFERLERIKKGLPPEEPKIWDEYSRGKLRYRRYMVDDEFHNTNGPAFISYYDDGSIKSEIYSKYNTMHRIDGPARIFYDHNGKITLEQFFIDGKRTQSPTDPRFANLDLADNKPPQKTDDKELGNRAKGLELNEKLNIIRETFKRLL